mmetsp:Transcript_123476/g.357029  ORF Transcript_123476/g.357029 Transcript_123476/m.357029 type:complete len:260 (-) Transcript_123476:153-932(-)
MIAAHGRRSQRKTSRVGRCPCARGPGAGEGPRVVVASALLALGCRAEGRPAERASRALRHPLPHAVVVEAVLARRLHHRRDRAQGLEADDAGRCALARLPKRRCVDADLLDAHGCEARPLALQRAPLPEALAEDGVLAQAGGPRLRVQGPEVEADWGGGARSAVLVHAVPRAAGRRLYDHMAIGAHKYLASRPREVDARPALSRERPGQRELVRGPDQAPGLQHDVPPPPTLQPAGGLLPHRAGVHGRVHRRRQPRLAC